MKKALLILDIQKDFTAEDARMPVADEHAARMIANLNSITKKYNREELPVVYIKNEFDLFDVANLFRSFAAIKGSAGCAFDERLNIVSTNTFAKNKNDAFSNPNLYNFLKRNSIETVVLAGVFAEGCVLATLESAINNHFKVEVLRDAIGAKTEKKLNEAIIKYENLGASLVSSHYFVAG